MIDPTPTNPEPLDLNQPASTPLADTPTPAPSAKKSPLAVRIIALVALLGLGGFIVMTGRTLWAEWAQLRGELTDVKNTAAIGYPGIARNYSNASFPKKWLMDEGETTLIWGGWKDGKGHLWFKSAKGEFDQSQLSAPTGRDAIRAIDEPVVEHAGGDIWGKIPDDASVVGHKLSGIDAVYPQVVLDNVMIVNDTIEGTPYLISSNPYESRAKQVAVYEPVVDRRRLTMGTAGYFFNKKPVLYDRETESLWVSEDNGLVAITGAMKGRQLRQIAQPEPIAWSRWRTEHPTSRLVVGAKRTAI